VTSFFSNFFLNKKLIKLRDIFLSIYTFEGCFSASPIIQLKFQLYKIVARSPNTLNYLSDRDFLSFWSFLTFIFLLTILLSWKRALNYPKKIKIKYTP